MTSSKHLSYAFPHFSHVATVHFLRQNYRSEYRVDGWVPEVDLELHASTSRGSREKTALVRFLRGRTNESAVWPDRWHTTRMFRGAMGQMQTEAANGSVLPTREAPDSQQPEIAVAVEQAADEVEVLQASIKIGTVAQIVTALIAMIGLLYLLKLVLVTILASILLAYVLE